MRKNDSKDIPLNLDELTSVTEQGMFGQLGLRDPNTRKVEDNDKVSDNEEEDI